MRPSRGVWSCGPVAGPDQIQLHLVLIRPGFPRFSCELTAIIGGERFGPGRAFLSEHATNPAWSPNGLKIVFHTYDTGDPLFVSPSSIQASPSCKQEKEVKDVSDDQGNCVLEEYNFDHNRYVEVDRRLWPLKPAEAELWLSGWNRLDRFHAFNILTAVVRKN